MEEEIDFETADFVNEKSDGDFAAPLGENEDPASDDDMEVAPRLRTESESSNFSQMSTSSKFSTLSNVSSLVAGGVFSSGVDEAEERFLCVIWNTVVAQSKGFSSNFTSDEIVIH